MAASVTEALNCFLSVAEIRGSRVVNYCQLFKEISFGLFMNPFSSAAVKSVAATVLMETLKIGKTSKSVAESLDVPKLAKSLHDLLAKSDVNFKSATVRHALYSLLGCICELYSNAIPSETAQSWFKFLLAQLKIQMSERSNKQPEWSVIAGCLVGLNGYLHSYGECGPETKILYSTIKSACDPGVKFTRYETPLAALDIFNRHAQLFQSFFVDEYREVHRVLSFWATHNNRDLRYAGLAAYDSFIYQISTSLTTTDERKHKHSLIIFKFFMGIFTNDLHKKTNLREMSMAVKGYGYFAKACKIHLSVNEVVTMFVDLNKRSEEIFLNAEDSLDDKISHLIQFLESFASIVDVLDEFPQSFQHSVEVLHCLLIENFPLLDAKYHWRSAKVSLRLFLVVLPKSPAYLNNVVFTSLIRICAHPPSTTPMVDSGDYIGDPPPSCLDFLPFWLRLSGSEAARDLGIFQLDYSGVEVEFVQTEFYSATVGSALRLIGRLDLGYEKKKSDEQTNTDDVDYQVNNLQDHRLLYSLEEFIREFLLTSSAPLEWFERWVGKFGYETIRFCTRYPLVSSLYRLFTVCLRLCKKSKYFDGAATRGSSTFRLFSSFLAEVTAAVPRYQGDLLSAALEMILALPSVLVVDNIDVVTTPLAISMSLGLTGHVIEALEDWSREIDQVKLAPLYKVILPLFDAHLTSGPTDSAGPTEGESAGAKLTAKLTSRQKANRTVRQRRKTAQNQTETDSDSERLKVRIVDFLGSIGGRQNHWVLDGGVEAEKIVGWQMCKQLRLTIPLRDVHLTIWLDDFLPRICQLAKSASNRQVKCAAAELLHAVVIYMVATLNQLSAEKLSETSMGPLYSRIIPVAMQLASDPSESVSEQLFRPLLLQLIHWWSTPERSERPESQTLVDAVFDGLISGGQFGVRELAATCVGEMFSWSLRHKRAKKQGRSTSGDKILLKIISFGRHPASSYRIGGCAALNRVYKSFREVEELVGVYTLELLATFIDCLARCHSDDESLGSAEICIEAIDHLARIVVKKADLLGRKSDGRLTPYGWGEATLDRCVEWLFDRLGAVETHCRLKCFRLIELFSPLLKSSSHPSSMAQMLKKNKSAAQILCGKFESAVRGAQTGQLGSLKLRLEWFEKILAPLDCYCWVAESDAEAAKLLFTPANVGEMKIFEILDDFLRQYAVEDRIDDEEMQIRTPRELLTYQRRKCTVISRLFDWICLLADRNLLSFLPDQFWSDAMGDLIVRCCFHASQIGFDMRDAGVKENLSKLLRQLLANLKTTRIAADLNKKIGCGAAAEFAFPLVSQMSENGSDFQLLGDCLFGWQICASEKLLDPGGIGSDQLDQIFRKVVLSQPNGVGHFVQSNANLIDFLTTLMDVIGQMESPVAKLIELITDQRPMGGRVKLSAGRCFYDTFAQPIAKCLLSNAESTLTQLEAKLPQCGVDAMMNVVVSLLDQLRKEAVFRRQFGQQFVHQVVLRWRRFEISVVSATEAQKLQQIYLMRKLLMIDTTFLSSTESSDVPLDRILKFYADLLLDTQSDMTLKVKLLDILPHFCLVNSVDHKKLLESAVERFVLDFFPAQSDEFDSSSLQYLSYSRAVRRLLSALELSDNVSLLPTVVKLICREAKQHRMEAEIIASLQRFIGAQRNLERQMAALRVPYEMLIGEGQLTAVTRLNVANRVLIPLLQVADTFIRQRFYLENIVALMKVIETKLNVVDSTAYRSQLYLQTGSFSLVALMYRQVQRDVVKGNINDSYANQLGMPTPSNTALLTKVIELCREAVKVGMYEDASEPMRSAQYGLRCAAYNCLAAALIGTQTKVHLFEGFLFSPTVLDAIVDPLRKFAFPVELDTAEGSGGRRKVRSIRADLKQQRMAVRRSQSGLESGHFGSSLFLADTSVSDDVNQFDFTGPLELPQSQTQSDADMQIDSDASMSAAGEDESTERQVDADELNDHVCMETLMAVVDHLDKNISPVPRGRGEAMPKWLARLRDKLVETGSVEAVKMFVCRLTVVNLADLTKNFAADWLPAVLSYLVGGCGTPDGLNTFFVDQMVNLLSWAPIAIPDGTPGSRMLVRQLMDFCMRNVYHSNRQLFRRNLELIKTVVETWKERISFSSEILYSYLTQSSSDAKLNGSVSAGIQLVGILVSNKIDPFVEGSATGVTRQIFYTALANQLNSTAKEIYSSAAEVIGMSLAFLSERHQVDDCTGLQDLVTKLLLNIQGNKNRGNAHFVAILNRISRYFPSMVDRFEADLISLLPNLYGNPKVDNLECILAGADRWPNLFRDLRAKNFTSLLQHRDDPVQQLALKILAKIHKTLTVEQLSFVCPTIVDLKNYSRAARRLAYTLAKSIYVEFKDAEKEAEGTIKQLAQDCLLRGLSDADESLRRETIEFWHNSVDQLPIDDISSRLVGICRLLHSPASDESFLAVGNFLLLEAASVAPGYKAKIFDSDLTDDPFQEYKIEADWRQKASALQTPMFIAASQLHSASQSQNFGLVATVADDNDDIFTPTMGVGDVSRSLGDTFAGFADLDTSSSQSSSALMFNPDPNQTRKRRKIPLNPAVKSAQKPVQKSAEIQESDADGLSDDLQYLKRRIVKDKLASSSAFFAQRQVRQKKLLEKKRQQKGIFEQNVVKLLRSYRIGDFPDVKIAPEAFIKPLQLLSQRDSAMATLMFSSLATAVIRCQNLPTATRQFCDQFSLAANAILNCTAAGPLIAAIQDISYDNVAEMRGIQADLMINSAVTADQQNVAILWLEEQLLSQPDQTSLARHAKRPRLENNPKQLSSDKKKIWLQIARLYKSIDMFDAVDGIFSSILEGKDAVQTALECESLGDYSSAKSAYEQAIREIRQSDEDSEVAEFQEEILIDYRINCLQQLCEWEKIGDVLAVAISPDTPTTTHVWSNADLLGSEWFRQFFSCRLKLFTDEVGMSVAERTAMGEFLRNTDNGELLTTNYAWQLAQYHLYRGAMESAKFYSDLTVKSVLEEWRSASHLMCNRRRSLLASLQSLAEMRIFVKNPPGHQLIKLMAGRTPDFDRDSSPVWDELLERRRFYAQLVDPKSTEWRAAVFQLRLDWAESAARQRNFQIALEQLSVCRQEWPANSGPQAQLRWTHVYSMALQGQSRLTKNSVKSAAGLIGAVELLAKSQVAAEILPAHLILRGSNVECLADVCLTEGFQLNSLREIDRNRLGQLAAGQTTPAGVADQLMAESFKLFTQACQLGDQIDINSAPLANAQMILSKSAPFDNALMTTANMAPLGNAQMTLADHCDKVLRSRADNSSSYANLDVGEYPAALVKNLLGAMKCGCEAAREKFVRLLEIVEMFPHCGQIFDAASKNVPDWMFLAWTPQILALLDKSVAPRLQPIVERLATTYPNALVYPMKLSEENYKFTTDPVGMANRKFVEKISTQLAKLPLINTFVAALSQLHQPDLVFKDNCQKLLDRLKSNGDKEEFVRQFKLEVATIFNPERHADQLERGQYLIDFANQFRKDFESNFGDKKLRQMDADKFHLAVNTFYSSMKSAMRKSTLPTSLAAFSPWLAGFNDRSNGDSRLEVPGQYNGRQKPIVDRHVMIGGFDDRLAIMRSVRQPKSLIVRGNDHREYKFLVKCGEDLRQDQRIEQLFDCVNNILARDHLCQRRNLHIRTYAVVPLTSRLGLIEFVPNTVGLREFIDANPQGQKAFSEDQIAARREILQKYVDWPKEENMAKLTAAYLKSYSRRDPISVAREFGLMEATVPNDSLSLSLLSLAASNEAFLLLRHNFARSHAVMSVVHYLLGIGDRHLSNSLMDTSDGQIVGIDFGLAFGAAVQLQGIPELVPFRLTKAIRHAMGPVGLEGTFKSAAIQTLRACREEKSLLLNILDVFVKEPSVDWLKYAAQLEKKGGGEEEKVQGGLEWYPKEKLAVCRQKLTGVNPVLIIRDELRRGRLSNPKFQAELDGIDSCLFGKEKRGRLGAEDLKFPRNYPADHMSCQQQLECLMGLAVDPTLLSRMWSGWEPAV